METVRKLYHHNKEVLVVDYSNQRGNQMIEIFEKAKAVAVAENKQVVILNIFNNKTIISPEFMQHVRQNLPPVEHLISKQAIIGLSTVQEWILKGMNLWYERKVHMFATQEEALDFLTTDQPNQKIIK